MQALFLFSACALGFIYWLRHRYIPILLGGEWSRLAPLAFGIHAQYNPPRHKSPFFVAVEGVGHPP